MADGRITRTKGGDLTEKQNLDREWQKISQVTETFDSIDKTYFLTQITYGIMRLHMLRSSLFGPDPENKVKVYSLI